MKKKFKVGVVFGGPSSEHEISIHSGKNILRHLHKNKYQPIALKIPKKGDWLTSFIRRVKNVDVIFLALHGQFGEDGKIQAILDTLHIPYTGSGALASSIAMNKSATYLFLATTGIRFPKSQLLRSKIDKVKIQPPCVVKPNASGSSIGVSIVKNRKEMDRAIKEAFVEDNEVLVEEYIKGKEFTCGVLGNTKNRLSPLPVIEIRTEETFFNYKAKYFDSRTQEICPAPISEKLKLKIQNLSLLVHKTIGCRGLTRSDFIVKNEKIYFLEINTIPGQTQESLCPKMAKANGWSLEEFFDKQIKLAFQA